MLDARTILKLITESIRVRPLTDQSLHFGSGGPLEKARVAEPVLGKSR